MLNDYADRPGHRGVSGGAYGFNQQLVADAMRAVFQVGIHAIGDAGNRVTLDFIDSVTRAAPKARGLLHRVEHAQVVSPPDIARFAALGVLASVQPPRAVEDKGWAETRVGAERMTAEEAVRGYTVWGAFAGFDEADAGMISPTRR